MDPSTRASTPGLVDLSVWLLASVGAGWMLLHGLLDDRWMLATWLHTATAWWPLFFAPVAILCLLCARWRPLALTCVAAIGWLYFNRIPFTRDAPTRGRALRIVSVNQLMVNPKVEALVAELTRLEPDVIVIQEFTPDFQRAMLPHAGRWPHSIEHPQWHSFGGAIYSRHPLQAKVLEVEGVEVIQANLDVDGKRVAIWNVHTLPPFTSANHRAWLVQVETIAGWIQEHPGPLVVAGDFNLTRHHQGHQTLSAAADDVYRRCGRWVAWTWPNLNLFGLWVPPVRLDQAFIKGGIQCRAVSESTGIGSDHRPIVIDLVL